MARTGIRSSAIIIRNKKVLLIHRRNNGEEYWTFPGGGIEEGETAEQTVKREVQEETGLTVRSLTLSFHDQTYEGGNSHPYFLCVLNEGEAELGGEEKLKNSEQDFYELQWIHLADIEKTNLLPEGAKAKLLTLSI